MAKCVTRPKLREIFAASFRDRIVHHLLLNKIGTYLDAQLTFSSYSCRENMGTSFGIKDIKNKIIKISNNYTIPCYAACCDISAFL